MPTTFQFVGSAETVFADLSNIQGTGVQLAPGETVELDDVEAAKVTALGLTGLLVAVAPPTTTPAPATPTPAPAEPAAPIPPASPAPDPTPAPPATA